MNLLQETLKVLRECGKTEKDIEWAGRDNFYISFEVFKELANVKYNSGFGGTEVALDLVIVGKDWWLERTDYDGSEWWEFKTLPTKPQREYDAETQTSNILFEC